jgi:Ca2+-transporting ATPase
VANHKSSASPPRPGENNICWYSLDLSQVVELLQTDSHHGLKNDQVTENFHRFGPNTLVTLGKQAWYSVFARQFTDVLVIILFIAALISLVIGDLGDAVTILVIVVFNGTLGFVQEWRLSGLSMH